MEVGMTCKCGDRECPLTGGNEVNDNKELTERARAFVLSDELVEVDAKSIWIGHVYELMASFAAQEREKAVREFILRATSHSDKAYMNAAFRDMFGKELGEVTTAMLYDAAYRQLFKKDL
jgi:hypothetical protein